MVNDIGEGKGSKPTFNINTGMRIITKTVTRPMLALNFIVCSYVIGG